MWICLCLFQSGTYLSAQLPNYNYVIPITVTDSGGLSQTNFPFRLKINTAALISAGHMQSNGEDIRFTDSCGSVIYPHYVLNNINDTNTLIWVRIPSLPASSSLKLLMFFGNPSANDTSSFSNTFQSSLITTGNTLLSGNQYFDWFQVSPGDTVFLDPGIPTNIGAKNVIIQGTIYGQGKGYPTNFMAGTSGIGPGAGGMSLNAGYGGGGYGGIGGTGGYDPGDTPGAGGVTYGTVSGLDYDMGSSGGTGSSGLGGAGGGALRIMADYIRVAGDIDMDGDSAFWSGSTLWGSGGGSGGSVLLYCHELRVTAGGTISANGGNGAYCQLAGNDSGGGGGGGRIKGLVSGSLFSFGTYSANGGGGGPFGNAAPGQPGSPGTITMDTTGFYSYKPYVMLGNEIDLNYAISFVNDQICSYDTIFATVITTGYPIYTFKVDTTPVYSGPSNTFAFTNLSPGNTLVVTAHLNNCFSQTDTFDPTIYPDPTVSGGPDQTICLGEGVILSGSGADSYSWDNFVTDSAMFYPTNTDPYIVTGIDTNNCINMDTVFVIVNYADAFIMNFDPVLQAIATLSSTYQWINCADSTLIVGETNDTLIPTQNGSFAVIVTDNGCLDTSACQDVVTVSLEETNKELLSIHPNPSSGQITIKGNIEGVFLLSNELGQPLRYIRLSEGNQTFDLNDLPDGVYFIQSTDPDLTYRSKVIISK